MPFFVPIEIQPSSKYEEGGHTLVAAADIKKGAQLWGFQAQEGQTAVPVLNNTSPHRVLGPNAAFDEAAMLALPEATLTQVLWGGYPHPPSQMWIDLQDGGCYTNHSDEPNCGGPWRDTCEAEASWAIRDINKGEEILDNYGVFHDSKVPWAEKLMAKHASGRHEFESECVKPLADGEFTHIPDDSSSGTAAPATR